MEEWASVTISAMNKQTPALFGHYRTAFLTRLITAASLAVFVLACGISGPVVKVTEIEKDAYAGLKKDDLEKVKEIKKSLTDKDRPDVQLSTILKKTPSFTVSEYLKKYPNANDMLALDYKVGGYDVLSITIYEEKDMSRESVRVSADGFITYPLIGRLHVADLTTADIEKLIARKLAEDQYLTEAHVSVMVMKYESRKFSVLGAVKTPGNYPLQAREKVLDALSKGGGVDGMGGSERGEVREAVIIRTLNHGQANETKLVINIDLQGLLKGTDQTANLYMTDNDLLYIPKADYFYIIGEVKNPGNYAFNKKNVSIVEAISMAGGFTKLAARNKTRIIRVENDLEKIYNVNVDAITQGGKMIQAVLVMPNDLIVVPESFF
jgi:polysaccharide export outer membrane protein